MNERTRSLVDVAGSVLGELNLEVVVDRVLESARELTGAQHAALGVLDTTLIPDSIPPRLAEGGAPPRSSGSVAGHPPIHSFIGVPIFAGEVPFGSLYLTDKVGGGPFTGLDKESVLTLAKFAGVAIDHALRYTGAADRRDELARTVAALEATTEIARAVAGQTDLDMILELVAKRGCALVCARALLIELVDGRELVVAGAAGERPAGVIGERILMARSLGSTAMRTSTTQRVEVELNRARFDQHGLGQLGVSAEAGLVVPLIFHGETYGVLIALDRLQAGPAFTQEDQRLLETFATNAATAVATAQATATELGRQRLAAAEDERGRWARELHDDTLQTLAALRIRLAVARRVGGLDALDEAVGEAIEYLTDGVANLRALVTDLRPAALDQLGLKAAVDALTHRASRHGLEIDSSIDLAYEQQRELTRHAPELETAIYRIIQESLTNATKHGHAKRAVVEIHDDETTVELTVRDDGTGFNPSTSTSGFGLAGIRERVGLLGGTVQITSSPDAGTAVTARFPAQRHRGENVVANARPLARAGSS
jgi:signal transduction histidine kinase